MAPKTNGSLLVPGSKVWGNPRECSLGGPGEQSLGDPWEESVGNPRVQSEGLRGAVWEIQETRI